MKTIVNRIAMYFEKCKKLSAHFTDKNMFESSHDKYIGKTNKQTNKQTKILHFCIFWGFWYPWQARRIDFLVAGRPG